MSDPNNWLNLEKILNPDDDPLRSIRINAINSGSLSDNKSVSTDATLQLNRKLNDKGRNVTFRGRFGYTNNDNNQYTESETHYFQLLNALGGDSILVRNQYITTPTKNYNYSAQLTYSEPIARATFLQFSYQFQYKYSESDKMTYDCRAFRIGDCQPSFPRDMKSMRWIVWVSMRNTATTPRCIRVFALYPREVSVERRYVVPAAAFCIVL